MTLYSYCWFYVPEFSFTGFAKFAKQIIIGYHHLWYIAGMIGAAIILIMLHKFSSVILSISILLTFLGGVLIQYLGNYHVLEGGLFDIVFNYAWVHRNMLFFSYPFFCVGYLINKHSLCDAVSFKSAAILSALGVVVLLGESYFNYYQEGRDGGFDNLLSLLLVCPFVCPLALDLCRNSVWRAQHTVFLPRFSSFLPVTYFHPPSCWFRKKGLNIILWSTVSRKCTKVGIYQSIDMKEAKCLYKVALLPT